MLWQRALRCAPAALPGDDGGAGARDSLVCALANALRDLLAQRGGDELAAAALRVLLDPRFAAWHGATAAEASRPPRVAAAAHNMMTHLSSSPCASLEVRACRLPASRAPSPLACAHFTALARGVRAAAPPQATGRSRATQMRAATAVGRTALHFDRYPVEALASLCHSVRGDELDGRCAVQRACATTPAAGVSAPATLVARDETA